MMEDRISFVNKICIEDISDIILNHFDELMLTYSIIPQSKSYHITNVNANEGIFELNIVLSDTSTALWFKSILDSPHPYQIYGRSLTIETFLNNCNLTVRVF